MNDGVNGHKIEKLIKILEARNVELLNSRCWVKCDHSLAVRPHGGQSVAVEGGEGRRRAREDCQPVGSCRRVQIQ